MRRFTSIVGIILLNVALVFVALVGFDVLLGRTGKFNLSHRATIDAEAKATCDPDSPLELAYSYVDSRGPGLVRHEDFGFLLNPAAADVNGKGFLGPCFKQKKQEGVKRIALVGDSFTASIQVPFDQTWPVLLQGALSTKFPDSEIEVVNVGVGGFGLDNQLAIIQHVIPALDADVVIQSTYLGNDISDNLHSWFVEEQAPHKLHADKVYNNLIDGKLETITPDNTYYRVMNAFNAFNTWNSLYLEGEPIQLNYEWLQQDTGKIEDHFKLSAEYRGNSFVFDRLETTLLQASEKPKSTALTFWFRSGSEMLAIDFLRVSLELYLHRPIVRARLFGLSEGKLLETANSGAQWIVEQNEPSIPVTDEHKTNFSVQSHGVYDGPFHRTLIFLQLVGVKLGILDAMTISGKLGAETVNRFQLQPLVAGENAREVPFIYEIYRDDDNSEWSEYWELFFALLKESEDSALSTVDSYHLFSIPAAISASETYWQVAEEAYFSNTSYTYSRTLPSDIMAAGSPSNIVAYHSFLNYLQDKYSNQIDEIYNISHRHFTKLGHEAYSDFVMQNLLSDELFSKHIE